MGVVLAANTSLYNMEKSHNKELISVRDYVAMSGLAVFEVYRLIDTGKLKTKKKDKKDWILL